MSGLYASSCCPQFSYLGAQTGARIKREKFEQPCQDTRKAADLSAHITLNHTAGKTIYTSKNELAADTRG